MAHTVPTAVPASLRAGDTATWLRSLADYPASDGWVLSYVLVKTGTQIAITSTASGADHLVEVAAATTAGWAAGTYSWQERATLAGKVYTTNTGTLAIVASFAAAVGGLDARTHAEKTLAALEAWIENHDPAVASYQIGDRQMQYISITDLLKLRDVYRREVRATSAAPKSGRVYLRF
jgi:hypothetical protein